MFQPKVFAVAFVFLLSFAAFGQDGRVSTEEVLGGLPDLEGWSKSGIKTFEDPALGSSVGYSSPDGGTVTVYAYTNGLAKIPEGTNADSIKDEVQAAKAGIEVAIRLGYYEKLEVDSEDVVSLSDRLESRRMKMTLFVKGQKLTSEIYVFGFRNHFLKIRSTRPFENEGDKNSEFQTLLKAIAEALVKSIETNKVPADVGN